jgi:hypothetical protein
MIQANGKANIFRRMRAVGVGFVRSAASNVRMAISQRLERPLVSAPGVARLTAVIGRLKTMRAVWMPPCRLAPRPFLGLPRKQRAPQ